jgi:hypothetical protein
MDTDAKIRTNKYNIGAMIHATIFKYLFLQKGKLKTLQHFPEQNLIKEEIL